METLFGDCFFPIWSFLSPYLQLGWTQPTLTLIKSRAFRTMQQVWQVRGITKAQIAFWCQQLDVLIKGHAMRLLKQLGEGGYAFVYLVKEVPSSGHTADPTARYALKKVLAGSQEALQSAEREISIQQAVGQHPCLLPLIDWAVVPPAPSDSSASHTVYMLSPAYPDGTLADELNRLGALRTQAGSTGPPGGVVGCVFSTQDVLHVFRQLCSALDALHAKGYAHRDVKVHNVLIRRPWSSSSSHEASRTLRAYQSVPSHSLEEQAPLHAAMAATDADIEAGPGEVCAHYSAVLMDFGSARQRHAVLTTRLEALQLQEDAEANCTATFRAPELWDAPSPATLDQAAADIWAAGCTLYATMYGQSPFQATLNQGGSLALAVINGVAGVAWPKDPGATYPSELHDLVGRCLAVNPQDRPSAAQLAGETDALLARRPPLPDPAVFTQHHAV